MRDLILKRIQEIRVLNGNFSRNSMRWSNFNCGSNNTHLSVYNFDTCNDEDLVKIFEKIVRFNSKQM